MTTAQLFRIALKTVILFILANALWLVLQPLAALETVSLYNVVADGRTRLPYGINGADYNLSPSRLGTLFATHNLRRPRAADEYRVVVLGDSSVWGILLRPHETLTEQLNALTLKASDGRVMRFYNLAYPMNSVLKDRLILEETLPYQPDLIVWLVTLESLARDNQFEPPLILANRAQVQAVIEADGLDWEMSDIAFEAPTPWDQTLIGQRRILADWLRLQAYSVVWSATGIDQIYDDYTPRSNDFERDMAWRDFLPETPPPETALAWEVLRGGVARAAAQNVPVIFVNEPIYRANGQNSDLHYNAWSPRWMYDLYREMFSGSARREDWRYLDAWDSVPPAEFTDSPVHLTPTGSALLAQRLAEFVISATHVR